MQGRGVSLCDEFLVGLAGGMRGLFLYILLLMYFVFFRLLAFCFLLCVLGGKIAHDVL